MLDILNEFQNAAMAFNPITLVVLGALGVLLGIVIWLGGTKYTRLIAAVVGTIGGAIGAFYFFPGRQIAAAISGAVVGAFVAIVVHKFIAAIAGAAVLAIAVVALLVGTNFNEKVTNTQQKQYSGVSVKLTQAQTVRQIEGRLTNIGEQMFDLAKRLPSNTWLAFAVAVVLLAVVAMFFGRLVVAFACSSLGTALIFAGMFNLLLYKGAAPLTRVYEQISFYSAVFAVMVVVGTVSQLILCRQPKLAMLKREQAEEKEKENKKNKPGEHKWTFPQS